MYFQTGRRALLPLFCILFSTGYVWAQSNNGLSGSGLSGVVKDANGAAVAQANVQLINARQAAVAASTTDGQGRFTLGAVAPGAYELLTWKSGYESKRQALAVTAAGASAVEVVLGVEALADQVTVTAETGAVQDRDRVTQQVNVINEDSITQRTTAVLAQVAEEEAGLSLQRTSPTIGAVLVRGLTEVGVFIDGVRFTNSTQRGGINTFFNLNDPTGLRAVEVLRGPNTAQYGSDSLGGTAQLITRQPQFGAAGPPGLKTHGEVNTFFTSADLSFGGNALVNFGTERFGLLTNVSGRRAGTLRPGGGIDSHSAINRFLGLPSDILSEGDTRLTDTAFTQYGGTVKLTFAPTDDQQINSHYQRGQQDGGKRYDQVAVAT